MTKTRTKIRTPVHHGQSGNALYQAWSGMCGRCFNPRRPRYATHGGRGIGMEPAWENDFFAFRDWALVNGYKPGLALNRIDKRKSYSPDNCRWVETYTPGIPKPVIRSDGRRFESLAEAARATPPAHYYGISLVCQGRRKTCGSYSWRYGDSVNTET